MRAFITWMESTGPWAPWLFVALFMAASVLMIWRLEVMSERGFEGTVLGTLVMPYCSGIGNLIFAFLLARSGGTGAEVMTNALVNNVTNMTLLIGLPTIFWGMGVSPERKATKNGKASKAGKSTGKTHELNRLSLMLTLVAVLFFTGALWALARRDGRLGFTDGLVLVGLFLFWQCFHVFDVLKSNVRQGKSLGLRIWLDLALLGVGAWATYVSIAWLVQWVSASSYAGYLGWLSGCLMVMPNALLAFYYGWRGQPEVVYTSQVGDGHICIPLCIGIYTLARPLQVPAFFETGMLVLVTATIIHLFFVMTFGRLPRWMGLVLLAGYGLFLMKGLA